MEHIRKLPALMEGKKGFRLNMLIGIDGFVDEIIHVVDKRTGPGEYVRLAKMRDFGERIAKAAGLSTNIEMVSVLTKLGGNGPILTNALLEYGAKVTYVGALGSPDIHPVFARMVARTEKTHSLIGPGLSDAVEFDDGKVMFGKHQTLKGLTWELMKERLGGAAGIAEMLGGADLFGMVNWTMMPNMSAIWQGIVDEVFPLMKERREKPYAFFDLADPEKRTKEDILEAMRLIGGFGSRFRAILGLNEKELYEIAEAVGAGKKPGLAETSMEVYRKLGVHCLVVHPVASALCVVGGQLCETGGPYCEKPALTTGAGDNFNAGFVLGMCLGLDPLSCLALGAATSGYYVRNAKSPTYGQAMQFLTDWAGGKYD